MRDFLFKLANNLGISSLLRNAKGDGITVLSLHRVAEERDFFFDPIHPKTFEKLVQYCIKNYEVIPFSEINKKTKKPKLILSFDDGHYDFMEHAVPILNKYNLPCNHNLVNACLNNGQAIWTMTMNDIFNFIKSKNITNDEVIERHGKSFDNCFKNWFVYYMAFFHKLLKLKISERQTILNGMVLKYGVGSKHRMMNWDDARMCVEKYNVEIGSHTWNHDSLATINGSDAFEKEIGNSVSEMEYRLNIKVEILALPNGQWNPEAGIYCEKAGLKYILFTDDHINPVKNINPEFNLISRIYLVNESIDETILRTELFHSKVRKFA